MKNIDWKKERNIWKNHQTTVMCNKGKLEHIKQKEKKRHNHGCIRSVLFGNEFILSIRQKLHLHLPFRENQKLYAHNSKQSTVIGTKEHSPKHKFSLQPPI